MYSNLKNTNLFCVSVGDLLRCILLVRLSVNQFIFVHTFWGVLLNFYFTLEGISRMKVKVFYKEVSMLYSFTYVQILY